MSDHFREADLWGVSYVKTTFWTQSPLTRITMSKSMGIDVTIRPDIFAERHLRRHSDNVVEDMLVQFGPVIRQDGAAFCRYTVSGTDGSLTRDIWGVDDVQAVELAMKMAGSDLDRLADGGTYSIANTTDGETSHGLPTFEATAMPENDSI